MTELEIIYVDCQLKGQRDFKRRLGGLPITVDGRLPLPNVMDCVRLLMGLAPTVVIIDARLNEYRTDVTVPYDGNILAEMLNAFTSKYVGISSEGKVYFRDGTTSLADVGEYLMEKFGVTA